MITVISVLLVLSITVPFGVYFINKTEKTGKCALAVNISTFFTTLIVSTVSMFATAFAAGSGEGGIGVGSGLAYIAAALVTGLSTVGAGIAVASAASAAIGAVSEDPKAMGKALIFVALAEGIALYGLLVSFTILNALS